jgi:hypothetical protein
MRTRDIIRQLRKLGASELEISSTVDADELHKLLEAYSNTEEALLQDAPFSLKDFVLDNQYVIVTVAVALMSVFVLSFKYNVIELLVPKGRTQALLKHISTFIAAGEILLALVLMLELVLEWYVSWTRISAGLSWILPNDAESRRYLAPMIYFPLSMDPANPMMNIGPMITLWLCRQVSMKLSEYVTTEMSKRDLPLPEKRKKRVKDEDPTDSN